MSKPGLAPKRHLELGSQLAGMRDRLLTIVVEIKNVYRETSPQGRHAKSALDALDKLRCVLDSAACREDDQHHQLGGAAIRAYYPPGIEAADQAYVDAVARTGAVVVSRGGGLTMMAPTTTSIETIDDILAAARKAVDERRATYGEPAAFFERVARRWAIVLARPVSAAQVALMMLDLKLVRLAHDLSHRDSLVDVVGYAACLDEITGAARPAPPSTPTVPQPSTPTPLPPRKNPPR